MQANLWLVLLLAFFFQVYIIEWQNPRSKFEKGPVSRMLNAQRREMCVFDPRGIQFLLTYLAV